MSDILTLPAADLTELPPGWRIVRFGDVVRFVKANADPLESGLERYVAGEHMETDNLHIRRWGTIGDGYLGPAFHRKFVAGQVLYGSRRTYLRKVAVAEFDGICANTTFVLEPSTDELIPELLPFIMQTEAFSQHSVKQSKGSVNPYINFSDLTWFEFALPPLDEQRRIAEILWAADEILIKAEETYLNFLQFRESLTNVLLGSNITKPVSNSSFHSLNPDYWTIEKLKNLVVFKNGINKSGEDFGFGTRFINISDTFPENLNIANLDKVNASEEEVNNYRLLKNDIIIVRSSVKLEGVGYPTIFPDSEESVVFSGFTIRLRISDNRIIPQYLLYYMRWSAFRKKMFSVATVTTNTNVNQKSLSELNIIFPSLKEQEKIVDILSQTYSDQIKFERHIYKQKQVRRLLIEELLNNNKKQI